MMHELDWLIQLLVTGFQIIERMETIVSDPDQYALNMTWCSMRIAWAIGCKYPFWERSLMALGSIPIPIPWTFLSDSTGETKA